MLIMASIVTWANSASAASDFISDGGIHLINDDRYDEALFIDSGVINNPGTHIDIVDGALIGGDLILDNNASGNMTGGVVHNGVELKGNSTFNFSAGTVSPFVSRGNSQAFISGGIVQSNLGAFTGGRITITGGSFGFDLNCNNDGTIFLVGSDFSIDGVPVPIGGRATDFGTLRSDGGIVGRIRGTLLDGSSLNNFMFIRANTGSEIFFLSENNPPVLDPIGDKTGEEGVLLTFQINATDPDVDDVLTFSANNLPVGANFDPLTATFSWVPTFDQAGNYDDVEFSISDNGDPIEVDVELITITIGDVNRAPVFDMIGSFSIHENELLEFTVSASDPEGDDISYSVVLPFPDGASFNEATRTFSWVPTSNQAGNYIVTFEAADDGLPVEVGQLQVPVNVGDVPTPEELIDTLIGDIINLELDNNIENSYLANLKKV